MFLPLKADFSLPRFPVVTVVICAICIAVFIKQQSDWHDFDLSITKFCNAERSHIEQIVMQRIAKSEDFENCAQIFYMITNDAERSQADAIADMTKGMQPLTGFNKADSIEYVTRMLEDEVRRYQRTVPSDPDHKLSYFTGSWNPLTMITSSFAHGDWLHIIGNLVFFFAFAATVEVLIGPLRYLLFVVADSLFIGVTGSMAASAAGEHYWTLGLSGVVMGMMGLFAYLLPKGKIKCFYFFIVLFGTVAVPAWALAAWYIGGDLLALLRYEDHGVVNVMAHVMGGIGGYLFGLAALRQVRKDAELVQNEFDRAAFEARFR